MVYIHCASGAPHPLPGPTEFDAISSAIFAASDKNILQPYPLLQMDIQYVSSDYGFAFHYIGLYVKLLIETR